MVKGMQDDHIRKRLQRQIEGLYSNEALTSDLDDSSAKVFLDWAESRITEIVGLTVDLDDDSADEELYPKMKAVRRMARYINRVARGHSDDDQLFEKILNQAREIYGSRFQEPDRQQLDRLKLMSRSEPAVFIQTIRQLFEGDMDGQEEANQQD